MTQQNPWNNKTALIAVAFAFFAGLVGALALRQPALAQPRTHSYFAGAGLTGLHHPGATTVMYRPTLVRTHRRSCDLFRAKCANALTTKE